MTGRRQALHKGKSLFDLFRSLETVGDRRKTSLPPIGAIAAVLPCYTPEGDNVQILTMDGQRLSYSVTVRTILRQIAKRSCIDLINIREWVGILTGYGCNCPLPLANGLLLLPLKVRKPLIPNDPCMGYINYHAVEEIFTQKNNNNATCVRLTGGETLNVLWSVKALKDKLRDARLAELEIAIATSPITLQTQQRQLPYR